MDDKALDKVAALPWTEERVIQLRKLWLEGLSASRIAAELAGGVSRNAVIGKVHRLGLSGRIKAPLAGAIQRKPLKPADLREQVPQRVVALPTRGLALVAQGEGRRPGEGKMLTLIENVTIMELRETMCRWPVGDPASVEFRYCGDRASIGGGPYCKAHSRMAYQPAQDRRQRKIA